MATATEYPRGYAFRNSAHALHSSAFNWDEYLTVVRRDTQSYGCTRYVVRDRNGRRGYAFATA